MSVFSPFARLFSRFCILDRDEGVTHTHTLHKPCQSWCKFFIFCLFLQLIAGCTLEDPLYTHLCPETVDPSSPSPFLGVIAHSIYEPIFAMPDGYLGKYPSDVEASEPMLCPINPDLQLPPYEYCVHVEDPVTHEHLGMACSLCPQDALMCRGKCRAIKSDSEHCGQCGRKCIREDKSLQECRNGQCFDAHCPKDNIQCAAETPDGVYVHCIDPSSEHSCGATCRQRSGQKCKNNESCLPKEQAGETSYACTTCQPGYRQCQNGCIPSTDACVEA